LLALWKRREMTASMLNRGLLGAIFLTLIAQIFLDAVVFASGVDPWFASTTRLFLWFAVTGMATITLDSRLWPSSVFYLGGFIVGGLWRDAVFPTMSVANFAFLVNAVVIWWPRRPASGSSPESSASPPPPSPR
jgi:hypothetical protein